MSSNRVVVGLTGASGIALGVTMLEMLAAAGMETHLVASKAALQTLAYETDLRWADVKKLAHTVHPNEDIAAPISSGSFRTRGMVVAPCSMKTLGELASGAVQSLVSRAADVTLKERRRLVLLPREAPLNLVHLRNMTTVTEMGGIIFPPVPAFYNRPQSVDDIIRQTAARALDLLEIETPELKRWDGGDPANQR